MPGKAHISSNQILAVLFILAGSLWLTSCTSNQTLHQTYIYKGPSGFYDVTFQKAIAVQWQPQPGPKSAAPRSDLIFFRADLIGPFLSVNDLLDWARQDSASSTPNTRPVVASAPLQKVDTWTNRVLTSSVPVPVKLPPGLYDLRYTVTVQSQNGNTVTRSDAIIKIHCPEDTTCY
jgi:hypothetical protein